MFRSYYLWILTLVLVLSISGEAEDVPMREDTTLANEYFAKAEEHAKEAQYDSSNFYFEKASAIYENAGVQHDDPKIWEKYIKCYNTTGSNLTRKGDYNNAMIYLNRALEVGIRKLGEMQPDVAMSYNNIGFVYWSKGDYDKTLEFYNKALAIRLEVLGEKHPHVAGSFNNIGNVYWSRGDYNKTLEFYNKALAIRLEVLGEKHLKVANSFHNIGNVFVNKGDYDKALEFYHKALAIRFEVLGEKHLHVAISFNNIGDVYKNKGDYDKAFEFFNKSLAINLKVLGEKHPYVAYNFNNIGDVYSNKGNYEKALEFFNKSLAINLKVLGEKHPYVAISYNDIGSVYWHKGDYDQALDFLNKSLAIRLEVLGEKHPYVAKNYRDIGDVYDKQGDITKTLHYYQKSMIALISDFDNENISINPRLKNISNESQLLYSLNSKAVALKKLSQKTGLKELKLAESTFALASQLIDKIRSSYKAEGSKLLLAEESTKILDQAIQTALELYGVTAETEYIKNAFQFSEKNKGGILLETLSDAQAKEFAGIPNSLIDRQRQLSIDLAGYDRLIAQEQETGPEADSAKIVFWQDKMFAFNQEYETLIKKLERDYPAYYDLKYRTKTISLAELQQNLAENEVLLQYFLGDSALHIFAVSNNGFDVASQPIDSAFTELIDTFHTAIKTAQKAAYIKSAFQLYNILILPVAGQIQGKENLVIIPHGMLYKIPFEALLTQLPQKSFWDFWGGDPEGYHNLDYLLKQFNISYHYSATLYASILREWEKAPAINDDRLLALAPVFREGSEESKVFEENEPDSYWESMKSLFADIFREGGNLNELPFSEGEVQGITNQFEQKNKIAHQLLFDEASEANFKNRVHQYNYVHLATHSFANEEKPALSGIAFSQLNDSSDNEDDILYSGEAFNLNLNADLLVLSSCESGYGALVRGEGMMALTRGFLYAGAKNIIYSLWNVYDEHTSHLMIAFYQQMLSGDNYSQALRKAKLEMIKDAETAVPVLWSGFLLLGR
jgi:CHAT domain-containing protein/Tfp pilus assembly protein PilF